MSNREKAVYNLSKVGVKFGEYVKSLGITEEQGIDIFKDDNTSLWPGLILKAKGVNSLGKSIAGRYIDLSDLLALPDSSVKACQTSTELVALISRLLLK